MYIYLSKYLYDTVGINILYAYEAHNFAPPVEIENASFASSSPKALRPVILCAKLKTFKHLDN